MKRRDAFLRALVVLTAVLTRASTAHGMPAPSLQKSADDALHVLVPAFGDEAAPRLVGAYVAFDPSVTEATALAACDDDGDPVVMVTAAFLDVMASLAATAVADVAARPVPSAAVASGASSSVEVYPRLPRVEAYADALVAEARSRQNGATARPAPPPAGTFDRVTAGASSTEARLYDALVETVIAIELAHLANGDVVCAAPTATREAADADWSSAEAAAARRIAHARRRVRERHVDAEAVAARAMARARAPRDGALVLHRFLAAIEKRGGSGAPPLDYLATHLGSELAFEVFRASWQQASEPAVATVGPRH